MIVIGMQCLEWQSLTVFRGIVGPWCHDWPDCNRPGNIPKKINKKKTEEYKSRRSKCYSFVSKF